MSDDFQKKRKNSNVKIGDWLEYGQYSIIKVIGIRNSMLTAYVFIPNPEGGFYYVGEKNILRNLIQGPIKDRTKIKKLEENYVSKT